MRFRRRGFNAASAFKIAKSVAASDTTPPVANTTSALNGFSCN